MKRAIVVPVMVLLLALIIVQTVRVNYWKKLAGNQTASCNAVIEINSNSCQKAINNNTDTWLQLHDHLWNVYKLEEARLANREGIINRGEEVQLLKLTKGELEAVRDSNEKLLNGQHTVTFLEPKGK